MNQLISALNERSDVCCDDVWLADSTPVECARPARARNHAPGPAVI